MTIMNNIGTTEMTVSTGVNRNDLSDYLSGKTFFKIPKDLLSFEFNDENELFLTIYFYIVSHESKYGTSRFSIGDILFNIFMFEKKVNKPKVAFEKIVLTICELQNRGIIKLTSEINKGTKLDEMIEVKILNKLNPSENYIELYIEEFNAMLSYCRNVFQKYNINVAIRFYLYVKGRTFNGTSSCIQSASKIGRSLGYSKSTACHYLQALCEGNEDYEPLLVCFKSHNGVSQTDVTYVLNKKFKQKTKKK